MANRLVIATDYAGADLGAKINAADADLGSSPGIIVVPPGDYMISTRIVLSDDHSLHLGDGLYDNNLDTGYPIIVMGNRTALVGIGSRWGARLKEPQETGTVCVAVADPLALSLTEDRGGVSSSDLLVQNIRFVNKSTTTTQNTACVHFANVTNATVQDCFFEGVSGYGVQGGGNSSLGNHADGLFFRNNVFLDVGTQNIAVVNARNVFVEDNLLKGGSSSGNTYIDLELNTDTDVLENFHVRGNTIYPGTSGGLPFNPGVGINVVGGAALPAPKNAKYGEISGNVIIGGETDVACYLSGGGINVVLAANVKIYGNVIKFAVQAGITLAACDTCDVTDNRVIDCTGNGDANTIILAGCRSCTVDSNKLSGSAIVPGINEISTAYYGQTSDYNLIRGNRLEIFPRSDALPTANPAYDLKINITGQHTRAYDNVHNDRPFDTPGLISTTELRDTPIPGVRHADAPATATLIGTSASGDAQPSLWQYDSSSTEADNGVTVVTPHHQTGNGRWVRAPLFPKMTSTQRDALSLTSADAGRIAIFNTTTSKAQMWDGSAWQNLW